jgi:cytochrome c2
MMRRLALAAVLALGACKAGTDRQGTAAPGAPDQSPGRPMVEQRILRAAMLALPPGGVKPESLPDPASAGARLLAQYCTQCHALPSPAMHGAQDWPFVTRQMWLFIDELEGELGVRSPSTAERVQLLNYLDAHALQVAATLPPGPGKATFVATCSRCHVLPDPRRHSPPDWPNVVMRMERNMERFRLSGVTHQMAESIVSYLQMASAPRR